MLLNFFYVFYNHFKTLVLEVLSCFTKQACLTIAFINNVLVLKTNYRTHSNIKYYVFVKS